MQYLKNVCFPIVLSIDIYLHPKKQSQVRIRSRNILDQKILKSDWMANCLGQVLSKLILSPCLFY